MNFAPGDIVEIISPRIHGDLIKVGMRGTVVRFEGESVFHPYGGSLRHVWLVNFHGIDALCECYAIKKIPPDPGRECGYWDECPWHPAGVSA